MSIQLSVATRYDVVLSDSILSGVDAINAFEAILYEFSVPICSGDISVGEFEVERKELIQLRGTIEGGGEDFKQHAVIFRQELKKMNITQDGFLAILDRMIKESDQHNRRVHFC